MRAAPTVQEAIERMLERPAWLWPEEAKLVSSIGAWIEAGRQPTEKQSKAVLDIYSRFKRRQKTRVYEGGSPGGGRRR